MKYVLIFMLLLEYKPVLTTAEFDSKAACEKAAASISKRMQQYHIRTFCEPKGDEP